MPQLVLENLNLENAERRLCVEALSVAGNIVGAAARDELGSGDPALLLLEEEIRQVYGEWP